MNAPPANVVAVVGGYRVTLKGRVHIVNKQRACSCGRRNCPSIQAVTAYLRAGGQRAPAVCVTSTGNTFPCPICQAEAHGSLERRDWACTLDRTHFFTWRVQRIQTLNVKPSNASHPIPAKCCRLLRPMTRAPTL